MALPKHITNLDPEVYLGDNYIVMDFETTNIAKGSAVCKENILLYSSFYSPKYGIERIEGNENELSKYLGKIYKADFIVCHNAKFELGWLMRAGLKLEKVLVYDTMLAEYVRRSNRGYRIDLGSCLKKYKITEGKDNYISLCISGGVCPSTLPRDMLHKYCDQDVNITHKLFLAQRKVINELGLLPVVFTRCLFTNVVTDMEMRGMHLDRNIVQNIHLTSMQEYNKCLEELDHITGKINMASPLQVAVFMYNDLGLKPLKDRWGNTIVGKPNKTFPAGMPKTNEDVISKLVPKTKKQRRFLELKKIESKLRKRITSYTSTFVEACEDNACMLYGKINQSVTVTQRLSSSKPNLQNIDRKLKKVVSPRTKGWKIRQADYDQLEYRAAGFLANCPVARQRVSDGIDAHAVTAHMLYGEEFDSLVPKSKEWHAVRTRAKSHTFKPLYGGMSGEKEEVAYYKWFMKTHTGIQQWHYDILSEAMETDEVRAITGHRFFFPNTEYTHSGYIINSTNIKNYGVQYFATAEIATIGVLLLWHGIKEYNYESFIINEVHDSVVIEEHPDEGDKMEALVTETMEQGTLAYLEKVFDIKYDFPLTVDQELHTNWGFDK